MSRRYPVRSALTDMPRVADLPACREDAVRVLKERHGTVLAAPTILDTQEELPERTKGILGMRDIPLDPVFIGKFHNATLLNNRDIVTADGHYVPEFFSQAALHHHHPSWTEGEGGPTVELEMPEAEDVPGVSVAFFFSHASGDNHSHFLVQTLPQLSFLEQAGIAYDRLIVMPSIRAYQYDILAALGCPKEKVAIRTLQQAWRCETLYVCYISGDLPLERGHVERLRATFGTPERGPRRLYVSRQDARGVRRFLNEEDVIEKLEARGFTTIVPSALSAAQEVQVFRDARIILGPLGAGLYNSVFTEPGGMILGMSDPHYAMPWLAQSALLSGLDHGMSFGACFMSYEPAFTGTHNNWVSDPGRVAAIADELIARYDPG